MRPSRRLVEAVLGPLSETAWRRGVLGGDRAWLGIGLGVMLLRRIRRREEDVVLTERLGKGQSLLISHGPPPPTRRARRRARRAARPAVQFAAPLSPGQE